MVLVDTSVWSLALRRASGHLNDRQRRVVGEWRKLIEEGRVAVIGPIRQETLSGIRKEPDFERLREHLTAFPDTPLHTEDFEHAARLFNRCRSRGLTGTPIDMLICAVADRRKLSVFTTDRDFERYAQHLPIRLHARKLSLASI